MSGGCVCPQNFYGVNCESPGTSPVELVTIDATPTNGSVAYKVSWFNTRELKQLAYSSAVATGIQILSGSHRFKFVGHHNNPSSA